MEMERDFKGVWIPKEIWLDNELSWIEKLVLVEIDSLAVLEKGCIATNEYLGKFFNLSKDRISKIISSLKNKGYIEVNLIYKPNTKQILQRRITTLGYRRKQYESMKEKIEAPKTENKNDPIVENDYTPTVKNNYTPIVENNYTPIVENDEYNNTDKNNTIRERESDIGKANENSKNKFQNTGIYFQEVRMILSGYNLNFEKIARYGKPIQRIKDVVKFARENQKAEGWITEAIRDDYKLVAYDKKPKKDIEDVGKKVHPVDDKTEELYKMLGI